MGTALRSVNPFAYARPVDPDEVVGRDDETARLVALAEGAHNVTLYAPRRFGKTTLVRKLLRDAERDVGTVPVFVDLSDVLSPADLAMRIEAGYRGLRGPLGRAVRELLAQAGIGLRLGPAHVDARTPTGPGDDPLELVHELLELPARMYERAGRRVLVVFDEFQALLALDGMDGVVRSHIQHHGSHSSYVFCGSEPSLLRGLFEDRSRPLYGQAEPIRLGRLPPRETAEYVAARFAATGKSTGAVLGRLVAAAEGHPQRAMLLAHRLWEEVAKGEEATSEHLHAALRATMRQLDAELEEAWRALSLNERRVVTALAHGISPYAAAAADLTGLRARSSAQRAVESLTDRTILEVKDTGEPAIVDPFLGRWARRRGEPRPRVYVVPGAGGDGWDVLDGPSRDELISANRSRAEAEADARAVAGQWGGYAEVVVLDPSEGDVLPRWARG